MKRSAALPIALALREHFLPACDRCEIAGSLRREEEEVKDIDLVMILNSEPAPWRRPEFGKPAPPRYASLLDYKLAELLQAKAIHLETNGPRKKRIRLEKSGIAAELWIVSPPAQWGIMLALRTGPRDFSHWIVTRRNRGGALKNGYRVQSGAVWEGENEVSEKELEGLEPVAVFDEEIPFLEWLELGDLDPKERKAEWGKFGGRKNE